MALFNLLPPELAPNKRFLKISLTLRKIAVVSFSILAISFIAVLVITYLLTQNLNKEKEKEQEILRSIKALEETEISLLLVQDRLVKISEIDVQPTLSDEIIALHDFINDLPDNVFYNDLVVSENTLKAKLSVSTSDELTNLFTEITSSQKYTGVNMESLGYSTEDQRYAAFLELTL